MAYGLRLTRVLRSPGDICLRIEDDSSTASVTGAPGCRLLRFPAWIGDNPCHKMIDDCVAAFADAVENHRIERVAVTLSPTGEPSSAEITAPGVEAERRRQAEDAALCILRAVPHEYLLGTGSC